MDDLSESKLSQTSSVVIYDKDALERQILANEKMCRLLSPMAKYQVSCQLKCHPIRILLIIYTL